MDDTGIILEHFNSNYVFLSDTYFLSSRIRKVILENISGELIESNWYSLKGVELSQITENLELLLIKNLQEAVRTFEPSLSSNLTITHCGIDYLINLRSDEGRLAKFSMKLYYILKANYFSGYSVKLILGNENFYEEIRKDTR